MTDPMRQHYLDNAERVLRAAEARRDTYAGPCSKCRYYRKDILPYCVHPLVKLAAHDAEAGYDANAIQRCNQQRSRRSSFGTVVCGPDGALWEPREQLSPLTVMGWVVLGVLPAVGLLWWVL